MRSSRKRRLFQMLCGNIALNALDNVSCHQQAVGRASGSVSIPKLPPADTFFNFGAVPLTSQAAAHEVVPLTTLDALQLAQCRVLKVDAEEMEPQVLEGARDTIRRCQPVLYVENDRPEGSLNLSLLLREIGYRAYWSIAPYIDHRNFYCNTVLIWSDYVVAANLLCLPAGMEAPPDAEPFLGESDHWKAALERIRYPKTGGPRA